MHGLRGKSNLPPKITSCSGKGKMSRRSCSNLGRGRTEEFTPIPAREEQGSIPQPGDGEFWRAQSPQDKGCSSEEQRGGRNHSLEKLIRCWIPPSTSRLWEEAAALLLTHLLQAPAPKCSEEFLQTLLIWHTRDEKNGRKGSADQSAELHHAPDDLTGLLTPSQSTEQPKHHSHPRAALGQGWLCPDPGMTLLVRAKPLLTQRELSGA